MIYYIFYIVIFFAGLFLALSPAPIFNRRRFHDAVFAMLIAVMVFFLWRYTIPGANYVDFTQAYYRAGQLVVSNPEQLYQGSLLRLVNIPIVALLFVPLGAISEQYATRILTTFSIAAVALTIYLLRKSGKITGVLFRLAIWLLAASGPLMYSIKLGNLTHFLLPLIAVMLLWHRQWPVLTGALAAICAIIKLPLMLLGIYFVLSRRWGMAVGFGITLMTIVACSLLMFGLDLHLQWYFETIGKYSNRVIGAYNNQSVYGFLAHLQPTNDLYSWVSFEVGGKFRWVRMALTAVMVFAASGFLCQSRKWPMRDGFVAECSSILCLSILISPISWIHYYALLLVSPIVLLAEKGWSAPAREDWMLFLATFLMSLPVFHTLPDTVAPEGNILKYILLHIVVSHYFGGGVLFLAYFFSSKIKNSLPAISHPVS